MSEKVTQQQIVLSLLKERGAEGASAMDILRYGVYRAAARVQELRQNGWNIETKHNRGKTAVYVLVGKTLAPADLPEPRIGADPSLWDTIGLGGRS